ncbi:MAG: hypothetical protein JWM05_1277 [Acidimicrobiales bacterium]|nr:hypothetical protein [Acidimicrobiales bacterium]
MRALLAEVGRWQAEGGRVAIARVVGVQGSAPPAGGGHGRAAHVAGW